MKKKEKTKKKGEKLMSGKPNVTPPPVDEEKPFDFGGIPDRDLKKNLGCG
jgi:hypothetical protein